MKLITELVEDAGYTIVEGKDGKKEYYIEGIFLQSEKKNRNGRIYPESVMDQAVSKYIKEYIETGRACGELNHPPTIELNPDRFSHRIVSLVKEGNNYIGKALILDTTCGKNVKAMLDGGVKLGVSSRGLGTLQIKEGTKMVGDDFFLKTVDIVQDPSAQDAFVNGICEGVEYTYDTNGKLVEHAPSSEEIADMGSVFLDKLKEFTETL